MSQMFPIDHREQVHNSNVITMVALIDDGMRHLANCPSKNSDAMTEQDTKIMLGWVEEFEMHTSLFCKTPGRYMPCAHPFAKNTPVPPELAMPLNPKVLELLYMMTQMRTQLLMCKSADDLSGFHPSECETVFAPWVQAYKEYIALIQENQKDENRYRTWRPDNRSIPRDLQPA